MEHYETQFQQNGHKIVETYESHERKDLWTDNDKQQLEVETCSILDPKEEQLQEGKQKNLEIAHAKKTKERTRPFSRKLNPKEGDKKKRDCE